MVTDFLYCVALMCVCVWSGRVNFCCCSFCGHNVCRRFVSIDKSPKHVCFWLVTRETI